MRVMKQSPDPLARMHTMTNKQGKSGTIDVKAVLAEDEEFLRALVRTALQEVLEAEMTEALGAEKGERAAGRQGYRSGYYGRTLITRVGKLELRVPQDRMGRFSTELFERYQRSERALVAALAEMYVQGVSTRKVRAITEELCGHSFSASSISAMNQRLDDGLAQFAGRPLVDHPRYLLRLAELELIDREQRMVERRIKDARFPTVKSLDSFEFAAIPSLNKTLVLELARCEYVARRENVIAVGAGRTRGH